MDTSVQPNMTAAPHQLLWIDGVGGFLLCTRDRVFLGQGTRDQLPDIPLQADVSRFHAAIQRDREGYTLEAMRPCTLNGKSVDKSVLRNGDRITLGSSCQLRFVKPVAISPSACLEIVSGHRLQLPVQSILLMADALILGGPAPHHIPIGDLEQAWVLIRQQDVLTLRRASTMKATAPKAERIILEPGKPTALEQLSLTLETWSPTW